MPIKIKEKTVAAAKPAPEFMEATDLEIAEVVDGYANVKAKIDKISADQLAPLEKKLGEYKKRLQEYADNQYDANEKGTIEGNSAYCEVGEKGKSRKFTEDANEKMVDMMGEEVFLKVAKVTLADCDKYLSGQQREEIIVETQEGSRSLKITKKAK